MEETKNKYSWNIPDQPTKRDIRKWEKENNVVLGVWSITNQTAKMAAKQFVEYRIPWIVPPIYPKEKEGKQFIFLLLGFHPANVNTQEGDDKELEDIERIDAFKIHEKSTFLPDI